MKLNFPYTSVPSVSISLMQDDLPGHHFMCQHTGTCIPIQAHKYTLIHCPTQNTHPNIPTLTDVYSHEHVKMEHFSLKTA